MFLVAYIDAGSGTMLLQVILAGVVAVPFFFRQAISNTWHRLRGEGSQDSPSTAADPKD